jgi:hypothetical protein
VAYNTINVTSGFGRAVVPLLFADCGDTGWTGTRK